MSIDLTFETPEGTVETAIRRLLCAGYTGRTRALVEAHIEELKALGIGAPPHIPMLFPIMPSLLTQSTDTAVIGPETAPEVEYVFFRHQGRDFVTVGSDQTDSAMEGKAACLAKNLCFKSIAKQAWPIAGSASDVRALARPRSSSASDRCRPSNARAWDVAGSPARRKTMSCPNAESCEPYSATGVQG